jgi:hypothetical protein
MATADKVGLQIELSPAQAGILSNFWEGLDNQIHDSDGERGPGQARPWYRLTSRGRHEVVILSEGAVPHLVDQVQNLLAYSDERNDFDPLATSREQRSLKSVLKKLGEDV